MEQYQCDKIVERLDAIIQLLAMQQKDVEQEQNGKTKNKSAI